MGGELDTVLVISALDVPRWGTMCGMVDTADDAEIWTTDQVAEYCGIKPASVRKAMARWGVPVHDREVGRGGQNRYPADAVRAAASAAPGSGNRTPRRSPEHPGDSGPRPR